MGCGAGAWLKAANEFGVLDVVGVDGSYVNKELLLFNPDRFIPLDITNEFNLSNKFDMVQCLEVAEHISPDCCNVLIDNLVRHSDIVLFSAAPPGQGGENHINERSYKFWCDLFKRRNYEMYDFVRPSISANTTVEPWYRYNIFLFANAELGDRLPSSIKVTKIVNSDSIRDVSPMLYRVRKFFVAKLPIFLNTKIAYIKSFLVARSLAKNHDA